MIPDECFAYDLFAEYIFITVPLSGAAIREYRNSECDENRKYGKFNSCAIFEMEEGANTVNNQTRGLTVG